MLSRFLSGRRRAVTALQDAGQPHSSIPLSLRSLWTRTRFCRTIDRTPHYRRDRRRPSPTREGCPRRAAPVRFCWTRRGFLSVSGYVTSSVCHDSCFSVCCGFCDKVRTHLLHRTEDTVWFWKQSCWFLH